MHVEMIRAQVPVLMPYIALTTNIVTNGPNSLRILSVCSALKGNNRFRAPMDRTSSRFREFAGRRGADPPYLKSSEPPQERAVRN
jgi:hypothetical protein